uniref:Yippee like 4 n=1 Tax=Crocodylus porosus TaxID=8502 RepID=A0A7M4ENY7_CROPO
MPSCEPVPPAACLPAKTFRSYLPRCHRTYSCIHCRAHLAKHDELISKSFQGSHGRAYLFNSVNKPSRPARSTRRESTSSRCHTWHQSWAQTGRLALRWQSSGLRACRQQHLLSTLRCRSHQGAQNLAEASLDSESGESTRMVCPATGLRWMMTRRNSCSGLLMGLWALHALPCLLCGLPCPVDLRDRLLPPCPLMPCWGEVGRGNAVAPSPAHEVFV